MNKLQPNCNIRTVYPLGYMGFERFFSRTWHASRRSVRTVCRNAMTASNRLVCHSMPLEIGLTLRQPQ